MTISWKALLLVLLLLSGYFIFGCMVLGTDDQFKQEWQNSESRLNKELDQIQIALGQGGKNIDYNALSYHSGEIVKIVDKEHAMISDIQVSNKYSEAKSEYLSALTELRSGYVDTFVISGSGDREMLNDLISSGPYLKSYIEKRERVKTIIELVAKYQ
jgi:hypothetical protein